MTDGITPSQTVGPYFAYCLTPKDYDTREIFSSDLTVPAVGGQRIRIVGRVLDGDGVGVGDAMIEIWQADPEGRYAHPADARPKGNTGFAGFGRAPTTADGLFAFTTVKPGPVPGPEGRPQAPHIAVTVFARGLLKHLYTRIYFEDEAANAQDPILALVPDADARQTLIARRLPAEREPTYRFDIRLQGEGETVFFEA
jgi:protocatechuate 3,4-dioxygenase, alpha subunit